MAGIPSHIEQALRTLEHVDRTMLIECGADKRIRQLWRTTETKKKAKAFDSSFESPKRLAAMYGTARAGALDAGPVSATASRESPPQTRPFSPQAGRSRLLEYDFCARIVMEWSDVTDVAALGGCCALARVRARPELVRWKALKRRLEKADLAELEATLRDVSTSARAMFWALYRLSTMGAEGVAYEHGRRLKISETLRYPPSRVTELTALCRVAERMERSLYQPRDHIACPPKLVKFAANHYSMRHVYCERADVHSWTRHSGSKYWSGVWALLSRHCEFTKVHNDRSRYVLERFVFPRAGQEWIAVAEVAIQKRFYSPQLELVAQLKTSSQTMYLKVKPADRAADSLGARPRLFEQCAVEPVWLSEVLQVPATCML